MPSVSITKRRRRNVTRYAVRYRTGGRESPVQHAGSFATRKEAKARRDLVAGELAALRNPADALRAFTDSAPVRTLDAVANEWLDFRADASANTRKNLASHLRRIVPVLGDVTPDSVTPADVNRLVGLLAQDLAPGSVKRYVTTLRSVLDYAGIDPNPARHGSVKLPRVIEEEPNPPNSSHLLAILDNAPERFRLPLIVMEQTAMRVGETIALTWADVDEAGCRFRIRASVAQTRRSRWAQVPDWLMLAVSETTPPDDRVPERLVFQGISVSAIRHAMRRVSVENQSHVHAIGTKFSHFQSL